MEEKDGIISTSDSWTPGLYTDIAYDGKWVDTMIPVKGTSDDSLKKYDAMELDVKVVNNALNVGGEILDADCKVFITDGDELTETDASGLDARYTSTDPLTGYIYTVIDNKKVIEVYVVEDENRPAPGSETTPTVQAFEPTKAENQTFSISGEIASGTPDEAKGAFTEADMAKIGRDYFVAAVTLPGTAGWGGDAEEYYAIRVKTDANKPSNWKEFPWGEGGTNDKTLYEGVKRFRTAANYEANSLAVLMLPGTTATVEVMLKDCNTDHKGAVNIGTGAAGWNTQETATGFDDNFKATYTITIDASGVTCVTPAP